MKRTEGSRNVSNLPRPLNSFCPSEAKPNEDETPGLPISAPLLFILALSLALHVWRLGVPPKIVFDETYYVKAAKAILGDKSDPNWVHPPLGKVLTAGGILIFGDKPWGWRFPAALAAAMAAGFFFLLAHDLFHSTKTAFAASLIYLMDGITYVQGRLAMLDIFMLAFLLPSIYFFTRRRYVTCALFLGLSLSAKWTALFVLPLFFFSLWSEGNMPKMARTFVQIIVPALFAYFLVVRLFTFSQPFSIRREWKMERKIARRQWNSLQFHLRPSMKHPYGAPWWKWVLLIRPIWYKFDKIHGKIAGIVVLPNPLLWWPALLACLGLLWRFKDPAARFIFFGAFSFCVPWAASLKGGFMYYLLPASPFFVLALVYWMRKSIKLQAAAVCWCALGFALFFPIYSYIPISQNYLNKLIWLKSWV